VAQAFATLAQRLDPDARPAGQAVVLKIEYDAVGEEPPLLGERYVLVLPAKAPSAELWYQRVARPFIARLSPEETPSEDSA
jgi:hypothetical protein